jgi:soluble lytic murein transglycosylase-like protein
MDINELHSYNLKDAVRFHNRLNPRLWGRDEHLLPEVRNALIAIAADFQEFLGIKDLEIKDITISGSNAAYSYTPHSDIDLHLVVDIPESSDEVYRELFNAKKYQYNESHDIKVRNSDVELYVQPADEPHISQGIYSIKNNKWIDVPKRKRAKIDDTSVRHKYEDLEQRINQALRSKNLDQVNALIKKIRDMRQAGLEDKGEFGAENLAYKILRSQGIIQRLYDTRDQLKDQQLSLKEREPVAPVKYGFVSAATEGSQSTPDGVSASTCMFTDSVEPQNTAAIVKNFYNYCCKEVGIESVPKLRLHKDPEWSRRNKTFGMYDHNNHEIHLSLSKRHVMDVLRTLAHELTHARQYEVQDVPDNAGDTGSEFENEANALAGILMRDFGRAHPEYFELEINESKSRYTTQQLEQWVRQYAQKHNVPYDMARHVYQTETGWMNNADRQVVAKSPAGAKGVMQLMPRTAKSLGVKNIFDPEENIDAGIRLLSKLLTTYKDPNLALIGYNWGTGNLAKWREQGSNFSALPKETQKYVASFVQTRPAMAATTPAEKTPSLLQKAGQAISTVLGIRPAGAAELSDQSGTQYQVQKGDTFAKIAQQAGMSLDALAKANPQIKNVNRIYPGDVINLPNAVNEGASGYIPSTAEKNDPRYKTALTVDIKPDTLKKNAAKLGSKIARDGRPPLLREDQELLEVKMSPGALRKWADSPEANGIIVGFEAEMIFPEVSSDDYEFESEPDYDADETVDGIRHWRSDIRNFFVGDRNTSRTVNNVISEIEGDYQDYVEENFQDYLEITATKNYQDQIRDLADFPDDEVSISDWEKAEEEFGASVRDEMFQEYRDDDDTWESFLESIDCTSMSGIANRYNLDWPVWTEDPNEGYFQMNLESLAQSLERAIGMRVRYSDRYHGASRGPNNWIIEPDGSLDPDNGGAGLEVVSPPQPLDKTLQDLEKFLSWAEDQDAYTNDSTGFHVNVSVPFKKTESIDYLKLITFMGDEYVLNKFQRQMNMYCKSVIDATLSRLEQTPDKVDNIMKLMKSNLIELAHREISKDIGQAKYSSAHKHDDYVEFRGPGGEYFQNGDADQQAKDLQTTILRLSRAMQIAADPSTERKEYAKKLSKLLDFGSKGYLQSYKGGRKQYTFDTSNEFLQLFSQYASGTLTPEQLKRRWAETVLKPKKKTSELDQWEIYDLNTLDTVKVLDTRSIDDAKEQLTDYAKETGIDKLTLGLRPHEPKTGSKDRQKLARRILDPKIKNDIGKTQSVDDLGLFDTIKKYTAYLKYPEYPSIMLHSYSTPDVGLDFLQAAAALRRSLRQTGYSEDQIDNLTIEKIESDNAILRPGAEPEMRTATTSVTIPGEQSSDANYEIVDYRTAEGHTVFRFIANTPQEAMRKLSDWVQGTGEYEAGDRSWRNRYAVRPIEGRPTADPLPGSTQDRINQRLGQTASRDQEFTGTWEVVSRNTDEVVFTFGGIGNEVAVAEQRARNWAEATGFDDPIYVRPVMRPRISEATLIEARMTPSDFGKAIKEGGDLGVLVGYEFEVCVPKATLEAYEQAPRLTSSVVPNFGTMTIKGYLQALGRFFDTSQEFDKLMEAVDTVPGTNTNDILRAFLATQKVPIIKDVLKKINKAGQDNVADNYRYTNVPNPKTLDQRYQELIEKLKAKGLDLSSDSAIANHGMVAAIITEIKLAVNRLYEDSYRDYRNLFETDASPEEKQQASYERSYWAKVYSKIMELRYYDKFSNAISRDQFAQWTKRTYGTDRMSALVGTDTNPGPWRIREGKQQIVNSVANNQNPNYDAYRGRSPSIYGRTAKFLQSIIEPVFGKTTIFSSYHQQSKNLTDWYIEPDGSLQPKYGDGAAEIVSPPMPARQAIEALKKFYDLARQYGLYTSAENKTGLHINVSIPRDLDVLKLALFLGDNKVLKDFDRANNAYARSTINNLKQNLDSRPWRYGEDIVNKLKSIVKSHTREHMASINDTGRYVSFRHAGGDYLNKPQSVEDVVGRFVRSMLIASDPNAYREEYLTKAAKYAQESIKQDNSTQALLKSVREKGLKNWGIAAYLFTEADENMLTDCAQKIAHTVGVKASNIVYGDETTRQALLQSRGWSANTKQIIADETDPKKLVSFVIEPISVHGVTQLLTNPLELKAEGLYHSGNRIGAYVITGKNSIRSTDPSFKPIFKQLVGQVSNDLIAQREKLRREREEAMRMSDAFVSTLSPQQQPAADDTQPAATARSIYSIIDNRNGEVLFPGRQGTWSHIQTIAQDIRYNQAIPPDAIRIIDMEQNRAYMLSGQPATYSGSTS